MIESSHVEEKLKTIQTHYEQKIANDARLLSLRQQKLNKLQSQLSHYLHSTEDPPNHSQGMVIT